MDRRAVNVRLTAESLAGWEQFCTGEGVTLTALLEVLGTALAQRQAVTDIPAYRETEEFQRIIAEARQVTADSRKRRRT
jgi:hypothetical protein